MKHTLDHMIANGDIKPIIAVSPTYYAKTREHNLIFCAMDVLKITQID
ncbi:MAG: hypothetical protein SPF70_00125 [Lachnospiraceae bacterium]|nr:hypothetical protein [Lachnospiraceae bacterium]